MTVLSLLPANGSPSETNAAVKFLDATHSIPITCDQVALDERIFSHIHLDAFLSNSALEGGDPEYALKYLKNALAKLQKNLPVEDQSKALELLTILKSFRKGVCASDVSNLAVGQKLLVRGGWGQYSAQQGHAMLYLLEKSKEGHFNITIFNTGAGSERHTGSSAASICPVQKYVNVPWGQIELNTNYGFFEHLADLLKDNWNYTWNSNWKKPDNPLTFLYEDCFERWEQYKDRSVNALFMKGQKSGTCSYRVFLALFKSYLSPKVYKLFKYYLKRDSFLQFYEQCKADNSLHIDTKAILLKDAGEKLLRSMAKLYCPGKPNDSLLEKDEVEQTHAKITTILKEIDQVAPSVQEGKQLVEIKVELKPFLDKIRELDRSADLICTNVPNPLPQITPESFLNDLTTFTVKVDKKSESAIRAFEIEQFTTHLPMPEEDFWKKIPSKQIVSVLEQLYKLLRVYYKCTRGGNLKFILEKQNAVLSIYATMYTLALRKDKVPEKLKKAIGRHDSLKLSGLCVCLNKEVSKRHQELLTYLPTESYDFELSRAAYLKKVVVENAYFQQREKAAREQIEKRHNKIEHKEEMLTLLAVDEQVLQDSGLEHFSILQQSWAFVNFFFSSHGENIGADTTTSISTQLSSYGFGDIDYYFHWYNSNDSQSMTNSYAVDRFDYSGQAREREALLLHRQGGAEHLHEAADVCFYDERNEGLAKTSDRLSLERDLASASCIRGFRVSEVLAYFRQNFAMLSPFYQNVFDVFLFRAGGTEIYEEAQKECFLEQCRIFINEGLEYCFERHLGQIDVHKVLFFILFCDRIKTINPKANLPNLEGKIEELSKLPYINSFEKRALHLHRLFHYSTLPREKLSDDILQNIVTDWFYYNNSMADVTWDNLYLFWHVRNFMFSIAPLLEKQLGNSSIRNAVLSSAMKELGHNAENSAWEGEFPRFKCGNMELSVLQGQVFKNANLTTPFFNNLVILNPHYQKLFQGELFNWEPLENSCVGFEHPHYGAMQLRMIKSHLEIFRKINGEWYQYESPEEVRKDIVSHFPPTIFSGKEYACFVALGDEHKIYLEPVVKGSGKRYLLTYTTDKYSTKTTLFELDENGAPKYSVKYCALDDFEAHGLALENDTESFKRFPRYRSLATGQTLSFCGPKLEWEENRAFTMQEKKPLGLLGKVDNHYLFLRNATTQKAKILVPLQRVLPNKDKMPTYSHRLDIDDYYKYDEDNKHKVYDFLKAQIGIYQFLEFDVVDGKIIPLSVEGTLFKAYIALLNRQYEESKRLLESVASHEKLSDSSLAILDWIRDEGIDASDFSPSAAAVRLSAICRATETKRSANTTKDIEIYRKSYSSVAMRVRLNTNELNYLEGPLEHYAKRRPKLENSSLALIGGIDKSFQFFEGYFESRPLYEEVEPTTWSPPVVKGSTYVSSLQKEFADFLNSYQKGHEKNAKKRQFLLKKSSALSNLFTSDEQRLQANFHTLHEAHKKALNDARDNCLKLANPDVALRDQLLTQGHYFEPLDIDDLINLFLLGDVNHYKAANPNLTLTQIQELDRAMQQFMLLALKVQKLERAQMLLKNSNLFIEELMTELSHPIEERDLLVFEYRANILLRKEQIEAVSKMLTLEGGKFKNLTLQMMMGGGKTSVLGSICLYKAAKQKGRLAVFIPPTAQFETLRVNLSRMQKRYFKQEVFPVKLTREELDLKHLQKLEADIKATIESQGVLLITKETLQTLELELLYILEHFSENVAAIADENRKKITLLQSILNTIRQKGDFLIDESDVLLSPNVEVNLPSAAPSYLRYEFVTLLGQIYKLHVSQELKYENRTICEIINLTRNEQNSLNLNLYQEKLQPLIARALLSSFAPFVSIPKVHDDAFVRYVCGRMNNKHLSAEDKAFLGYLKQRSCGSDEDKLLADQIALAKFMFVKILPVALTRNTGRNYGRSPQHQSGKVVPFLGVDTPSPTTEFGSPWIAAAYQFQTALSSGISFTQVKTMTERFAKAAEQEAKKRRCKVDETKAAQRFAQATHGRKISSTVGNDLEIRKLLAEINNDLNLKLALEQETVAEVVQYYRSYFGSTSQDFVLQCNSVRTFSGTPWNVHCYGRGLDQNVSLEEGVEGSIVDQMLRKAQGKEVVHKVKEVSVKSVLATVGEHKAQSLIDAGGIFKNFDNERVARDLLQHFKDDPQVEYILFFGRKEATDATPDHLMAFKKGSSDPIYIGSTRKDELEKRGITRENTFVYFDEKHCEATDLPLAKKSLGIITMSGRLDLRTQLQGIMRLREFFKEQDVEYVLPENEKSLFLNEGMSLRDCVLTFLTNQAKLKTEQAYRSARQKIRALFREFALTKILANPSQDTYNIYHKVFKGTLGDSPYQDYGSLDCEKEVKEALLAYVEIELSKTPKEQQSSLQAQANTLIEAEIAKGRLPETVPSADFNSDLQVEMERESEVVLETELQQELERYNTCGNRDLFSEKNWRHFDKVLNMPETQSEEFDSNEPHIYTLGDLLQKGYHYEHPYGRIFDDNVLASENWAFTYKSLASIFSPVQKTAQQILIIRDPATKKLFCILLSIRDAKQLKQALEQMNYKDASLYLADGSRVSDNPMTPFSAIELEQVNRMLLQANILKGDAEYLDTHEADLKAFLKSIGEIKEELVLRFLKLKVENNGKERAIFYNSVIKNFRGWSEQIHERDVAELLPEEIAHVATRWYKFLPHKKQIQAVPVDSVDGLIPSQVVHLTDAQIKALRTPNLINVVVHWRFNLLSKEQLQMLTGTKVEEVTLDRIDELTEGQIHSINSATWIHALPKSKIHLLSNTQLQKMSDQRIKELYPSKFSALVLCVKIIASGILILLRGIFLYWIKSTRVTTDKLIERLHLKITLLDRIKAAKKSSPSPCK